MTEPAVARITAITRDAAAGRTRHLVLLTGVPGSGKTLVGLDKVFVRDVKQSVRYYSQRRDSAPSEHLLAFDEAPRAWDAKHVGRKHDLVSSATAERADGAGGLGLARVDAADQVPTR